MTDSDKRNQVLTEVDSLKSSSPACQRRRSIRIGDYGYQQTRISCTRIHILMLKNVSSPFAIHSDELTDSTSIKLVRIRMSPLIQAGSGADGRLDECWVKPSTMVF